MNERNISDELLSKFMEGTTTEAENEQIFRQLKDDHSLATNLASMIEATKLTDKTSHLQPDMDRAKQQIAAEIDHIKGRGKKLVLFQNIMNTRTLWVVASVAVVLLLVILGSVVFRSPNVNRSEKLIAKQEVNSMNSVSKDIQAEQK